MVTLWFPECCKIVTIHLLSNPDSTQIGHIEIAITQLQIVNLAQIWYVGALWVIEVAQ